MAPVISSAVVAFFMLVLLIIGWPFSLAGMQILAADLLAGNNPSLSELLTRAKPLWTRMLGLGLIVYGSYFLWTVIPLLVALSLTAGAGSFTALFLALSLLIFTMYMVARLFVNFLFWQQAGALGSSDTMEALRESKDLARGGMRLPRLQRPLYRGALIASVWVLVILAINLAIELPAVLVKLQGVTSVEQASTVIQSMAAMNSLDFLSCLTTFLSGLAHAVLRPWLATIFVVLYLDTKRNREPGPND